MSEDNEESDNEKLQSSQFEGEEEEENDDYQQKHSFSLNDRSKQKKDGSDIDVFNSQDLNDKFLALDLSDESDYNDREEIESEKEYDKEYQRDNNAFEKDAHYQYSNGYKNTQEFQHGESYDSDEPAASQFEKRIQREKNEKADTMLQEMVRESEEIEKELKALDTMYEPEDEKQMDQNDKRGKDQKQQIFDRPNSASLQVQSKIKKQDKVQKVAKVSMVQSGKQGQQLKSSESKKIVVATIKAQPLKKQKNQLSLSKQSLASKEQKNGLNQQYKSAQLQEKKTQKQGASTATQQIQKNGFVSLKQSQPEQQKGQSIPEHRLETRYLDQQECSQLTELKSNEEFQNDPLSESTSQVLQPESLYQQEEQYQKLNQRQMQNKSHNNKEVIDQMLFDNLGGFQDQFQISFYELENKCKILPIQRSRSISGGDEPLLESPRTKNKTHSFDHYQSDSFFKQSQQQQQSLYKNSDQFNYSRNSTPFRDDHDNSQKIISDSNFSTNPQFFHNEFLQGQITELDSSSDERRGRYQMQAFQFPDQSSELQGIIMDQRMSPQFSTEKKNDNENQLNYQSQDVNIVSSNVFSFNQHSTEFKINDNLLFNTNAVDGLTNSQAYENSRGLPQISSPLVTLGFSNTIDNTLSNGDSLWELSQEGQNSLEKESSQNYQPDFLPLQKHNKVMSNVLEQNTQDLLHQSNSKSQRDQRKETRSNDQKFKRIIGGTNKVIKSEKEKITQSQQVFCAPLTISNTQSVNGIKSPKVSTPTRKKESIIQPLEIEMNQRLNSKQSYHQNNNNSNKLDSQKIHDSIHNEISISQQKPREQSQNSKCQTKCAQCHCYLEQLKKKEEIIQLYKLQNASLKQKVASSSLKNTQQSQTLSIARRLQETNKVLIERIKNQEQIQQCLNNQLEQKQILLKEQILQFLYFVCGWVVCC